MGSYLIAGHSKGVFTQDRSTRTFATDSITRRRVSVLRVNSVSCTANKAIYRVKTYSSDPNVAASSRNRRTSSATTRSEMPESLDMVRNALKTTPGSRTYHGSLSKVLTSWFPTGRSLLEFVCFACVASVGFWPRGLFALFIRYFPDIALLQNFDTPAPQYAA